MSELYIRAGRDAIGVKLRLNINRIVIHGGVDVDGNYIEISLCDSNVYHTLGGGMTGGGKSQFEKAMVLYLALRYPPSLVKLALSDVKLVSGVNIAKTLLAKYFFTILANNITSKLWLLP